ncbi:MAG: DUF503 domain-containing protein [Synergistaceae bacterium]|nr:DUF503 domain-containing protein [Synergistaceae bacterium]
MTDTPFSGVLFATLIVQGSRGVKDRRRVCRSLIERMRSRWNVSAMDLGPDGSRSKILLGVSAIAAGQYMTLERLDAVFSFLCDEEERGEFTIIHHWREVTGYDELSDATNQQAAPKRDLPSAGAESEE